MSGKYIMYDPAEFDKIKINHATDIDEITRLRAENEKLREALKPFAALGRLSKKLDDNTPCKTTIMSGYLRAAAAALKETAE